MKRCITMLELLLLSVVFILSGCGKDVTPITTAEPDEGVLADVYYISATGSDLVAESVTVPDDTRKGQLKFLIDRLITPPEGKISPLNSGTTLQSVIIQNDIAVVDFSKEFKTPDDLKNTLAPAAVAQTLCSLDYISGVQILVEGKEATGADGKSLGVIRESDLVINKDGQPTAKPQTTLTLYFGDEYAEHLVPERRNVEIPAGDTVEKIIVQELLKGPTQAGNIRTIPQEVKLLSIETKDNVCFVNFSKEFTEKHSGGTTAEQLTVYSVVNSLTELGTIDCVQFLIEGEKREEFIHMTFNEPILPNSSLVKQ